jgi:hypothetical protein
MFEAILAAIEKFDTIIIHRHNRPVAMLWAVSWV